MSAKYALMFFGAFITLFAALFAVLFIPLRKDMTPLLLFRLYMPCS
jgi:hypothetical protein